MEGELVRRWRTTLVAATALTGLAVATVYAVPSGPGDGDMVVTASTGTMPENGSTPFEIKVNGKQVKNLYPGASKPLPLKLSNPYRFDIVVTAIRADIVSTSRKACKPGPATVTTEPYLGTLPVTIKARKTTAAGFIPVVMAPNAPAACAKVFFKMRLVGTARKAQ
jgi:uncharacterized protein (DUF2126 family)